MPKEILEKITSGKFLLTIIAGCVFAYAVVTKMLSAEATATILVMVFISYFQKEKDNKSGETTTQTIENKTTEIK